LEEKKYGSKDPPLQQMEKSRAPDRVGTRCARVDGMVRLGAAELRVDEAGTD